MITAFDLYARDPDSLPSIPLELREQILRILPAFEALGIPPELFRFLPALTVEASLLDLLGSLPASEPFRALSRKEQIGRLRALIASRVLRRYLSTHPDAISVGSEPTDAHWETLAKFKYSAHLRAFGAELMGAAVEVTTAAVSRVADQILRLSVSEYPLLRERFTVIAMGKLGAGELNYASDVDLIYILQSAASYGEVDAVTQAAEQWTRMISSVRDGLFLYRVDLSLRPEGSQSPLIRTRDRFLRHLETGLMMWERYAYLKARTIISENPDLEDQEIASRTRLPYLDYRAIDHIRAMKAEVERESAARADGIDVKLGPGGIRELEFLVQTLQIIYAGKIPELRVRGTIEALSRLHHYGFLDTLTVDTLTRGYSILRTVEHGLQMIDEHPVRILPSEEGALDDFLTRLGIPLDTVEQARASIRNAFSKVTESRRGSARTGFRPAPLSPENQNRVNALRSIERITEILEPFLSELCHPPEATLTRGLTNFTRFVTQLRGQRVFFPMISHHPELVGQLATLFRESDIATDLLIRVPDALETVVLERVLDRDRHRESVLEELKETHTVDLETALKSIQWIQNRERLRLAMEQLAGTRLRADISRDYSRLADAVLTTLAERLDRECQTEGRVMIGALGRLGDEKLHFLSDLDLVFITDGPIPNAIRFAERLIARLTFPSASGPLYALDARLRPSGSQGMLVVTLSAWEEYLSEKLELWHRLSLFKFRPVWGAPFVQTRSLEAVQRATRRSPDRQNRDREEFICLIERMRTELGTATDIKRRSGGLLELELFIQLNGLYAERAPRRPLTEHLPMLFPEEKLSKVIERIDQRYEQTIALSSLIEDRECVAARLGFQNREALDRALTEAAAEVEALIDRCRRSSS